MRRMLPLDCWLDKEAQVTGFWKSILLTPLPTDWVKVTRLFPVALCAVTKMIWHSMSLLLAGRMAEPLRPWVAANKCLLEDRDCRREKEQV
jgi:hypothetical protein